MHLPIIIIIIINNKHMIDLWPPALTWRNKLPDVTKLNNPTGLIWPCGIFDCSLIAAIVFQFQSQSLMETLKCTLQWPTGIDLHVCYGLQHLPAIVGSYSTESINHDVTPPGQILSFSVSFFNPSKLFLQRGFVLNAARGGTVLYFESSMTAPLLLSFFALISWWMHHTFILFLWFGQGI